MNKKTVTWQFWDSSQIAENVTKAKTAFKFKPVIRNLSAKDLSIVCFLTFFLPFLARLGIVLANKL